MTGKAADALSDIIAADVRSENGWHPPGQLENVEWALPAPPLRYRSDRGFELCLPHVPHICETNTRETYQLRMLNLCCAEFPI